MSAGTHRVAMEGMTGSSGMKQPRLALTAPIMVSLLFAAVLLVLIARAAVGVPFNDEVQFGYLYNPVAHGNFPAWRDMLAAHNGHPYLILKTLLAGVLTLGLPWTLLMYAQVPVLVAAFAVACRQIPTGTGQAPVIGVLALAMVILTPRQWENLYWAMQFAFALSLLFSMLAFHFASRFAADTDGSRNLAAALACSLIASLCNGAGIFAAALSVAAIFAAPGRRRPAHLAWIVATSALIFAMYALSLGLSSKQTIGDLPLSPATVIDHGLRMLASSMADFAPSSPLGLVAGTLLALLVLWCGWHALRQWRSFTFELLCLSFGAVLVAGVTYARLRVGIFQPDASRYIPLMMPLTIASILILYRTKQHALMILLALGIAAGYLQAAHSEWNTTPYRHAAQQDSLAGLCATGEVTGPPTSSADSRSIQQLFCNETPSARGNERAGARTQRVATAPPAPSEKLHIVGTNGVLVADLPTPACGNRAVATLKWDAGAGVENVELWVSSGDEGKFFVAGGRMGEATTGPWVAPRTVFALHGKDRGKEIDRLAIPGEACPPEE